MNSQSTSFALPTSLQTFIGTSPLEPVTSGESGAGVFKVILGEQAYYLKVSRVTAPYPVRTEKERLLYLADTLAVPQVRFYVQEGNHQFLLMSAVEGLHPFHDHLNATAEERIRALAQAAQRFHQLPLEDCPFTWDLEKQLARAHYNLVRGQVRTKLFPSPYQEMPAESAFLQLLSQRPRPEDLVVVHGDLFPVNLLLDLHSLALNAYIDVGRAGISDRYTDLALCAQAIQWHYGESYLPFFFESYGMSMDSAKIRYYQLLNAFL